MKQPDEYIETEEWTCVKKTLKDPQKNAQEEVQIDVQNQWRTYNKH